MLVARVDDNAMSCIYLYLRKIFISRQCEVREAARAAVVCFVTFVLLGAAQLGGAGPGCSDSTISRQRRPHSRASCEGEHCHGECCDQSCPHQSGETLDSDHAEDQPHAAGRAAGGAGRGPAGGHLRVRGRVQAAQRLHPLHRPRHGGRGVRGGLLPAAVRPQHIHPHRPRHRH